MIAAGQSAVRLSPNEWRRPELLEGLKVQQLGEPFWLYIVVNCAGEPQP